MRLDLIGIIFAMLGICMLLTNPISGGICIIAGAFMVMMGSD